MKKIVFIGIVVIITIVISLVIFNKIALNRNEKEVLSVLKDLDYSLQNPKSEDDNTMNFNPTEPITLKEYIKTIYEVRKFNEPNGNLTFLFKVALNKEDDSEYECILMVTNGELISMTIDNELMENNNDNTEENDFVDSLVSSFQENFIKRINEIITKKWDEAIILNNVNFTKILNKI